MKSFIVLSFVLLMITGSTTAQNKWNQDWPNLQKYQAANEKLIQQNNYPQVVFMGNSITEGWVQQRPEFFEKNNIVGRGISGQTTPQMLIRFTPDVIDLKPKVVVILAGTNDIAGNTGRASVKMITDNLKAMAQLAKAKGIRVILSSILPVYEYPWSQEADAVRMIAAVNKEIEKYAEENGHLYLDYFPAMADEKQGLKKQYSQDGVHPNPEGYAAMEPLILQAIKKAL